MNQISIPLKNYLDLLVNKEIDEITKCPICLDGISDILQNIYLDLKKNYKGNTFQKLLKEKDLYGLYHWKGKWFPIPILKLKNLLNLWKDLCNKSEKESKELYNKIFDNADYFKARCSPVNVKIIKKLDLKIAYLIGLTYADGALRNVELTFEKEKRFRWEITITEELKENLETITPLLKESFGIKTNVKSVCNGRWYRLLFYSLILHRILNKVFEMPIGYKKGKLKVPELIKQAPFEIKKYFVIGFFDGDGWCNKEDKQNYPVVSVAQSSKGILDELNEILIEGGLKFRIYQKTSNNFTYYNLETKNKKQIMKFKKIFGFGYKNKKERLNSLVRSF